MITTSDVLTVVEAEGIVELALQFRREQGFNPMTVAVLDLGGHPILVKREDGCGFLRVDIAVGKAKGSLGFQLNSRELAERAIQLPQFMAAVASVTNGPVIPAAGGVLLVSADTGTVVGAVGVSGDTSDNDEACIAFALENSRFKSV
ncbi:GlcG/HbpS family heme-binding protein [Rhodococcus erythropolis]|uniref:GlcG/HbpS family heme-binding protein n=1 Tax=Rhodococcus erythropolis TaxID=1833 RepID=UPI0024B82964|nr:heme-binding protein [Rhodococcus erythropolis]MDJ0012220.1 heme-binding protein [Rhodococcus erythropolis]MDJ0105283.1 heme-binding protein [Rhodococcus erythropolis]